MVVLRLLTDSPERPKVIGIELSGDKTLVFPQVSFNPIVSEVLETGKNYSPKIQYHKNGTLKSILVGGIKLVKV